MRNNKPVEIYTDGSLAKDLDTGGYGIVMVFGNTKKNIISSAYKGTTSSRMEIKAVIRALEELKPGFDIYIYSDFKVMVDTINVNIWEWMELDGFHKRPNHKLWVRFLKARRRHVDGGSNLLFSWIRSHSGIKNNDVADRLAGKARRGKKLITCKDHN